jgi:hypothetical protein
MRRLLPLLAAATLGAPAARAQVASGNFDVGAHVGYARFASSSAIENSPFIGLDATYALPFNPLRALSSRTDFGIGFNFNASRPQTDGRQFPLVLFDFGDTTFLYKVPQRFTLLQTGLQAVAGLTAGRSRVYVLGGGGAYTSLLDARQQGDVRKFTKPLLMVGAGVNYSVTRAVGFRLEGRNVVFTDYDRDRYDASVAYTRDQRIGDVLPAPEPKKSRANSMQLSLVFSYVPNSRGTVGVTPASPPGTPGTPTPPPAGGQR